MEIEESLIDLGWNSFFESHFARLGRNGLVPGRVVAEFKGFYRVRSTQAEYLAETAGRLRHEASSQADLPAVGDWVAIRAGASDCRARIEHSLPRRTRLSRKASGRELREQIVAANMDVVFIVNALNREFNVRRLERYLTLVWDSGARPVIVLNKADLCPDPTGPAAEVEFISPGTPVCVLSAVECTGLEALQQYLHRGTTVAFVGSSGVGKSTIINLLAGSSLAARPVRESDDRGQHTTTSRQMVFLAGGAMVIDTPGMRELQLWDNGEGVTRAFSDVATLALQCRFRDCSHHREPGCAVALAVEQGQLSPERLENHRKLLAELRLQERKLNPEAARQEKQRWKKIHKAIRHRPEKF